MGLGLWGPPDAARAAEPVSQAKTADLEETLVNGLRATTASDKAFIARVVELVDDGALTERLVKSLFVRARAYNSQRPMPYFVAMIQKVAQQQGIDL
jgi:hypothetical protein